MTRTKTVQSGTSVLSDRLHDVGHLAGGFASEAGHRASGALGEVGSRSSQVLADTPDVVRSAWGRASGTAGGVAGLAAASADRAGQKMSRRARRSRRRLLRQSSPSRRPSLSTMVLLALVGGAVFAALRRRQQTAVTPVSASTPSPVSVA